MQTFISCFGILHAEWIHSALLKSIHSNEQAVLRKMIRDARLQAGLKQGELAGRLELPQSFVSKYELGERRLDLLELRRVCQAIGISLAEFVRRFEKELE